MKGPARRRTDPRPRRVAPAIPSGTDVRLACTFALLRMGLPANEMDFIRHAR